MAGVYSTYGIKRYIDETKRHYDVLESRLSKADWLAGDKYTIADIASFSFVQAAPTVLEIDLSSWPGVKKWVERISERPAVLRARKIPDTGRTRDQVAEMFKNMRARVDAMKGTEKQDS
jgi:glutathione S-transferase